MATTPQNVSCLSTNITETVCTHNKPAIITNLDVQSILYPHAIIMGIGNLCSSICIRYSLDLTSLRLLDMLYIRVEMFAAVCLF